MQRKRRVVVALLGASIALAGCGQALRLPAGNSAEQGVGTATPGVEQFTPASSAALPSNPPAVADASIVALESSASAPTVADPSVPAASDAPTAAPPAPTVAPTVNPEFEKVTLPGSQDRWRYVQVDRRPFGGVQTYITPSKQILWWYDPIFGRAVKLGEIQGDFPVQATFRFRGQEVDALEVPYQVNQSFGITLPPTIVDEIKKAGSGEWVETFVYQTSDIRPK